MLPGLRKQHCPPRGLSAVIMKITMAGDRGTPVWLANEIYAHQRLQWSTILEHCKCFQSQEALLVAGSLLVYSTTTIYSPTETTQGLIPKPVQIPSQQTLFNARLSMSNTGTRSLTLTLILKLHVRTSFQSNPQSQPLRGLEVDYWSMVYYLH